MVLIGFIALSLTSPNAALEERLLLVAPVVTDSTSTPEEPFTLSPCPEGAGCRSATPTPTSTPTSTPTPTPTDTWTAASEASGKQRWYGYQLIISDAFATFLALGAAIYGFHETTGCFDAPSPCGSQVGPAVVLGIGIGTFVLVPPLIHIQHHEYSAAGLSFALRALPVALLALAAIYPETGAYLTPLGILGLIVAMVIDDAYLANEPAPRAPKLESSDAMAPAIHAAVGLAYAGSF